MAKEKLILIKEAELTNNCPECFNQDLKVSFYQKQRYGKLYHKTTNEVTHEMICNKCGSTIYPVKWTDDIERSFKYYQKMAEPRNSSLKFTSVFWIIVLFLLVLVGIAVYFFLQGAIRF